MIHHSISAPKPEIFQGRNMSKVLLSLLGVGIGALLITLCVGFIAQPGSVLRKQFAFSWLFAFMYFFTMLFGCFFWMLVHHATDSGWGIVVRRQMENLASLLPWMALFFVPLFIFRSDVWLWITAKNNLAADPALRDKFGYFELHLGTFVIPFFWLRAVFYFLFFGVATRYFRQTSIKQDSDGDPKWSVEMRGRSFPSLLLFAACVTFSAFDWLAALDHHWSSTMWGVYIFAGAGGSSMSLIILVVLGLKNVGYLKFINEEHYHIMGKLLFTFTVFWAYIGFSQYMLIWYGNIPEETEWFIRRNVESWNGWSIFLVIGRFFIPFLFLLFQFTKRNPRLLALIAFWTLGMHLLDTFITVLPFVHPTGFQVSALDLLSLLAIGCPLAFLFLRTLRGASLFPVRDPRLLESLRLSN
jgi:hypothetical protein